MLLMMGVCTRNMSSKEYINKITLLHQIGVSNYFKYVFVLVVCSESLSGCQNFSISTTVPKGVGCMISLPGTLWGCIGSQEVTRDSSVQKFVSTQLSLGVSRKNIKNKIKSWMDNQQWVRWRGLGKYSRDRLEN